MFLSSISDTRQKVHFQKTQNFLFIFISSLLCFKNGGQEGHRKIPLSLKDHHYRLLQGLSARPSNLLILIPSSLFHSLSLINYSKFTLIIEYCVSQMMMVFPSSKGSLILILLHLVVGTPLFHSPHFFPIKFFEMF